MTPDTVRGHLNNARAALIGYRDDYPHMTDEVAAKEAGLLVGEVLARLEAATEQLTALWVEAQQVAQPGMTRRLAPPAFERLLLRVQTEL